MNDARARHLKRDGVLIPDRVQQFVGPVVAPRLRDELTAWDRVGFGLDLGPARDMSLNNVYIRQIRPAEILGGGKTPICWDDVDFTVANRLARTGDASWTVTKATTVYGLGVWWTASLADTVQLSTSPLSEPTHWEQLFFPAFEPLELAAGETLKAEIRTKSTHDQGTDIAWGLAIVSARGRERGRQALSLTKGFLP